MRLFKGFILTLGGLFIVITLFSLLLPSRVMTSRSVIVNVNDSAFVIQHLNNLHNWKNWNAVFRQPGITISPDGKNASWKQSSKTNSIQLIDNTGNTIRFLLKRSGEADQENKISVLSTDQNNSVLIEWAALTLLRWYPWEKFSGIFIEKITGQGYQDALDSLKIFLEQN